MNFKFKSFGGKKSFCKIFAKKSTLSFRKIFAKNLYGISQLLNLKTRFRIESGMTKLIFTAIFIFFNFANSARADCNEIWVSAFDQIDAEMVDSFYGLQRQTQFSAKEFAENISQISRAYRCGLSRTCNALLNFGANEIKIIGCDAVEAAQFVAEYFGDAEEIKQCVFAAQSREQLLSFLQLCQKQRDFKLAQFRQFLPHFTQRTKWATQNLYFVKYLRDFSKRVSQFDRILVEYLQKLQKIISNLCIPGKCS